MTASQKHTPIDRPATAIEIVICSDRGRPAEQQDAVAVGSEVIQSSRHLSQRWIASGEVLISVADGLAVSPAAARASRLALSFLHESFVASPDWHMDGLITGRHVRAAQAKLSSALAGNSRTRGASTTLVSAHISGNRVAVLNVGDSRAYLKTVNNKVTQLSHDHSERASLIDEPAFDEGVEYASIYDALSDCLVADPEESEFKIHRTTAMIETGDMLILCSDGVWEVLGNARLEELIQQVTAPMDLVRRIRTKVQAAGAPDNFSIVIARLSNHPHHEGKDS